MYDTWFGCSGPRQQVERERRLRREIANSNERRRMQSINQGYQMLKGMLPSKDGGEKLSKVQTSLIYSTIYSTELSLCQTFERLIQTPHSKLSRVTRHGQLAVQCARVCGQVRQRLWLVGDGTAAADHVLYRHRCDWCRPSHLLARYLSHSSLLVPPPLSHWLCLYTCLPTNRSATGCCLGGPPPCFLLDASVRWPW